MSHLNITINFFSLINVAEDNHLLCSWKQERRGDYTIFGLNSPWGKVPASGGKGPLFKGVPLINHTNTYPPKKIKKEEKKNDEKWLQSSKFIKCKS